MNENQLNIEFKKRIMKKIKNNPKAKPSERIQEAIDVYKSMKNDFNTNCDKTIKELNKTKKIFITLEQKNGRPYL